MDEDEFKRTLELLGRQMGSKLRKFRAVTVPQLAPFFTRARHERRGRVIR